MIVVRKVKRTVRIDNTATEVFQGILCKWFTTTGEVQEHVFNTKDLQKI
jgi:uncharacterized protein YodC (DUF2158 family)